MTALDYAGPLSEHEARALTAQIHHQLETAWHLIIRAYEGQAWLALGYDTWDAYCKAEFQGAQLRLPREERQGAVGSLREAGLSTRAIASATGQSQANVRRDLWAGEPNGSRAESETPDTESERASNVVGMDGKAYTPPPAQKRSAPRKALTDQAEKAGWDLRRAVERIERVAADDRFERNKEQVAVKLRGHLLLAQEAASALLARLDGSPDQQR